jgi:oligoribonuclease NrnB/cAMP/cGMP phosphodiesterase (DHH superfamily)
LNSIILDDIGLQISTVSGTSLDVVTEDPNHELHIHIDTTMAACGLAYLFCLEHAGQSDESLTVSPCWFIDYIQDRDLWTWKLPHSREINAAMYMQGFTFENFDNWCSIDKQILKDSFFTIGSTIIESRNRILESIYKSNTTKHDALTIESFVDRNLLHGWIDIDYLLQSCIQIPTTVLSCPYSLISDMGDYIIKSNSDPVIVLTYNFNMDASDKPFNYSVRSTKDSLFISVLMGGGGHPCAHGFDSNTPPSLIVKEIESRLMSASTVAKIYREAHTN